MQNVFTLEINKYKIKTENFEGPLDLLCHLIDVNQMDIYDISLSEITDQYIEYINQMEEMNLEVTSEFLIMASNLLYLKSKKLLPRQEIEEEMLSEEELIQRIIEYKQYKEITNKFREMYNLNNKRAFRTAENIDIPKIIDVDVKYSKEDVSNTYQKILDKNANKINKNARNIEKIAIIENYSVGESVKNMFRELIKNKSFVFNKLYSIKKCKPQEIVTAFSGLLEMSRRSKVETNQEKLFGEIKVNKKQGVFTMLKPLSVQLYSLRDYAKDDFVGVLKKVAEIGYKGVEPAGFWDLKPTELKKIVEDLGMKIYSSHSPWARGNNLGECMELADALGLKTIVCGYGPDDFKDLDAIKKTAENTSRMQEVLARNGYTLFQHNHYWEFERIDGRLKYEIFAELCPNVKFEIDSFWSTNKGTEDPVEMLRKFADRTILLHMKDGVCKQKAGGGEMVNGLLDMKIDLMPLGTGTLPIRKLVEAAPASVETIVVELDYCDTEMYKAIEMSYKFMTESGLAAGNK